MAAADSDWEDVPSYSDLARGIIEYLEKTYRETFIEKREPHPTELVTWRYYNISLYDIFLVLLLSIAWTILRHLATERIFKPLAHHYALTPANQKKMPESAWKFVFYLSASCYTCYVLILSGKYRFFQQPSTVWHGWTLEKLPPGDIYFLYMAQLGFYVHALYALLFLDTWRKDSVVLLFHHVLTLMLIYFSYSLRYHNIGCLVLFLHDVCDIFLEFAKLNVYFKIQGNKSVKKHEVMANILFVCFIVTWFTARLYWYPLRVLYSATSEVQRMKFFLLCGLFMNSLLWILQLLNIYWTLLILQILYGVVTGQVKEIDDTREYDVEEKISKHLSSTRNNHSQEALQNSSVKTSLNGDGNQFLNEDTVDVRSRVKRKLDY